MAGPDGIDRTLEYYYDDSPYGGPPLVSGPPPDWGIRRLRWPAFRRRRGSAGQRRFRLTWPYPGRRLGDALVFLTSADSQLIGSKHERHRYATVGVLMLVTAAQAFYAATLFFSVGLSKPFRSVIFFGIFFAVAVVLIDRSIISYAAPLKTDKAGNLRAPKKTNAVLFIRVVIAIVAAILMSEMILLQVFAGDIKQQIQNNHLAVTKSTDAQIEANFQKRIKALQTQINNAQTIVGNDQTAVSNDYQAMKCQEFGCPGIPAGEGDGFRAAQRTLGIAQQALTQAQTQLTDVKNENTPQIGLLNQEEQTAISAAQPAITNADKVLSQEEAFWQLTVKNGNVLVVRVLLSLLILGIDLAPILTKLTGRTTVHDIRAHGGDYRLHQQYRHETDVAVYEYGKQADMDRQLHDLAMGTRLFEAEQAEDAKRNRAQRVAEGNRADDDAKADLRKYQIRLDTNLHKLRHYRKYADGKQALAADRHSAGERGNPSPWPRHGRGGQRGAEGEDEDERAAFGLLPSPPRPVAEKANQSPDHDATEDPWEVTDIALEPEDLSSADESDITSEKARILWGEEEPSGLLVLDDRYVLYRRLPDADSGGGGIIWLAKDRLDESQEWLVVKTVPSGMVNVELLRMLQRELRVAGVLDSHIGEIRDHGDDRGFAYLVYPWYRPGSLEKYCKQQGPRLTLKTCVKIIDEVLAGLVTASSYGLVHLDLKPGNIVLDGEHARIIDWGLSRKPDASRPSTWVMRGTPFYACPEQLIQPKTGWDTFRADLYGVGATFYRLLAGEPALQREAAAAGDAYRIETYCGLLKDGVRPQPVHELVPGVPQELSLLIERWMSLKPDQRVPLGTPMRDTARVARDELTALLPALPRMTVGQVTGRRRRRWR